MLVGFAIDRWGGDPQLYRIAQCFSKAVTGSAWLYPDIEHKIITQPLIKHSSSSTL
jgi:hypothetical protein